MLQRYYEGHPPTIPPSLMAIHNEFTMPHEGGYQNHDSENGTLAGVTNRSFVTHMARLGVTITPTQSREILEHIGSLLVTRNGETRLRDTPRPTAAEREMWQVFQNLAGHLHYQAYNLRRRSDRYRSSEWRIHVRDRRGW